MKNAMALPPPQKRVTQVSLRAARVTHSEAAQAAKLHNAKKQLKPREREKSTQRTAPDATVSLRCVL